MAIDQRRPARGRAAERARLHRRNLATFCAIVALLAPLAIASLWVLSNVEHSTEGDADIVIEVQPGWGPVQVGDALEAAGVIKSSAAFQEVAQSAKFTAYTAGRYDFVANSDTREALDTLRGGPAAQVPDLKLLLPPGLTMAQIADRVGKLEGKSRVTVPRGGGVGGHPIEVRAGDGQFARGAHLARHLLHRCERERRLDSPDHRQAVRRQGRCHRTGRRGPVNGLDPYQTVVTASLIEAEAGTADDVPLISSVIRNRLKDNMMLQIDATLCYAKGGCPPVPTEADRKIDSPYNTYKVDGLPPTPIRTVSEVALRAALNPAPVPYLYYVADKNGKTYYATTLQEHERNVAKARSVG